LYAECPLKEKFYKANPRMLLPDMDAKTLISTALRDTYIHYFQRLGLHGQAPSVQASVQYFSRRWVEYKKSYGQDTTRIAPILIQAHEKIVRLPELFNDQQEIAAAGFPLERVVRGNLITDSADLIILNRQRPELTVDVYYFDTSSKKNTEEDFGVQLRANFGMSSVRRDLRHDFVSSRVFTYNILGEYQKEVKMPMIQRMNYPRIIAGLVRAVDAKAYYPRPSNGACNSCMFNQICSWRMLS